MKDDHKGIDENLKREKVVYVNNLSEDVWPFIEAMGDERTRALEIEENANLADRDLLSIADEKDVIFISPKPVGDEFVDYCKKLFGKRDIRILVPRVHTGKTCEDVLADDNLMNQLIEASNSVKKLTLKSYSTSEQFLNLVSELRRKRICVCTPEAPEEDKIWTVNFLGSKSGIRQLSQLSRADRPDFIMPEGLICAGVYDASIIAAEKYIKEKGVVIKTNKGHAGAGVLIYREGDLPSEYHACELAIRAVLEKNNYWERFPIVVESLVKVNFSLGGGFPNTEFKINKSGKTELLYVCGMRVSKEGVFKGIEINGEAINDRVEARIVGIGFYIGEKYADMGYRGYFEIDYIAGKNGEIYVTESNIRRTGGTHVYKTAMELGGKDYIANSCIYSNDMYDLPKGTKLKFGKLRKILSEVEFDKKKKEGVVIASENMLAQGKLSYIVFGKTKKRADEIERRMESLLVDKC